MSACHHPKTHLEWRDERDWSKSGPRATQWQRPVPTRRRLAKICDSCGALVCYSHSEHTELALGLYAPPNWKKEGKP